MIELITGTCEYIFSGTFLMGAWNTLLLTIISQVAAIVLGFGIALVKRSNIKILDGAASLYIWCFRGVPVLVQLIFVFNALPEFGIKLTGFQSALLALTLNESAYMAEIIRSGLDSVDKGQKRAANALGMSNFQIMRHVVLPQAIKIITPPTANQFNSMLKTSAMASVVGFSDLLLTAQQIASANFDYVNTLLAAVIYYLFFSAVFTLVQNYLENRMDISRKQISITKKPTILKEKSA